MSRTVTETVPGSYTITRSGSLIGTYSMQKSTFNLSRSEPQPGVRDGEWIHPTSYSASKTVHVGPYGRWNTGTYEYKGDLYGVSSGSSQAVGWFAPSYRSKLLSAAIVDARTKLSGDGFNLLQNIAERQQAIDLVADRLGAIYKSYRSARSAISAYRRGQMNARRWKHWKTEWKNAFRHLGLHNKNVSRRLSENVLAWNYGVAPLASDVDAAIQMFANPKTLQPMIGVTGKASEGSPNQYTYKEEARSGIMPRLLTYSELCSARCVLFANPENVALIRLAATKVNNLPLLVYELTPFSFLVDWVLPIGDWIDSIGSTAGWEFYSGYTMERTWCRTLFSDQVGRSGSSNIEGSRECFQFRRVRLHDFPFPPPPGFKNPWSLKHALNAVALFGARR